MQLDQKAKDAFDEAEISCMTSNIREKHGKYLDAYSRDRGAKFSTEEQQVDLSTAYNEQMRLLRNALENELRARQHDADINAAQACIRQMNAENGVKKRQTSLVIWTREAKIVQTYVRRYILTKTKFSVCIYARRHGEGSEKKISVSPLRRGDPNYQNNYKISPLRRRNKFENIFTKFPRYDGEIYFKYSYKISQLRWRNKFILRINSNFLRYDGEIRRPRQARIDNDALAERLVGITSEAAKI